MTVLFSEAEEGIMNKKKLIPVVVVVVLLISSVLYFEVFRYWGENKARIEGSGTLEVTDIDISTKIAGRITSISKDEGQEVKQGEVLVKLAYEELDAQRISVIANLNNARLNLKRIKDLYNTGSVSQKEYDNVTTAYRVALSAYEQINATIDNAVLVSPINGVVLEKDLEIGEIAFPGTPVLTIADITDIWIKIYVSEIEIGRVKLGQRAFVSVDSYPHRQFPGKVVMISDKAEFTPKTIETKDERVKLMFAVKIAVQNPKQELKPGMPADAYIITGAQP
jgi:HlyD family secretion protein